MKTKLAHLFSFLFFFNIAFCQEQVTISQSLDSNKNYITFNDLLLNQGVGYQKKNRHKEAIKSFRLGLSERKDLAFRNPIVYAKFIEGIAISNFALGKTNGVLKAYKEVLSIKEKVGDVKELFLTHINISYYYKKTGNKSLANSHAIKAFDYALKIEESQFNFQALEEIISLNINKDSKEYFKNYIALKEGLIATNVEVNKKLNRSNYLNSEKDKELSNLKEEKLLLENKLLSQENTSHSFGFLSLLILFLGAGLFFFIRKKSNKKLDSYEEKNEIAFKEKESIVERLSSIRIKLSSFYVSSELKEINKYSFYLREIESIEKDLNELLSKEK